MVILLLRLGKTLLALALLLFLAVAIYLWFAQDGMIYHPRRYAAEVDKHLPAGWEKLSFTTGQGAQFAYCRPPARGQPPRRTLFFFGGNGSLALGWLRLVQDAIPPTDAALLVEYPGYGASTGQPSPATILENTEAAADAFSTRLNISRPELERTSWLIGHSLGAACALQFAARHPVPQLILIAPFTRMVDMARLKVGWPLAELCRHRFNNLERLRELSARQPTPPRVLIFHGQQDDFIPIRMSRALAAANPGFVTLHEVPGAGHDSVVADSAPAWLGLIRKQNE